MLELKGITKKYNVFRAVDDVSFRIEPGEILGYLGPNGAGKTTTIKMLTGLLEPTSGEIFFHGKKIKKDLIEYKKRIGYVPEERLIFTELSVDENLVLGEKKPIAGASRWEVEELYDIFPRLRERRRVRAGYLSGGEQQMLTMFRTLVGNPHAILIDEPT